MNNVFMNHKRKKSQKRLSDKIKKCEEITISDFQYMKKNSILFKDFKFVKNRDTEALKI